MDPRAVDERRCLMCGARARETASSRLSTSIRAPRSRLRSTRGRRGMGSPRAKSSLGAVFVRKPDAALLFDRRARGERLSVLADPFSTMGQGRRGAAPSARREATDRAIRPWVDDERPPPSAPPRHHLSARECHRRRTATMREGRALVDAFLRSEASRLSPTTSFECIPVAGRACAHGTSRSVRAFDVRAASADGVPDEQRRAYASAWDVPDDKVESGSGATTEHERLARSPALASAATRRSASARWETPR